MLLLKTLWEMGDSRKSKMGNEGRKQALLPRWLGGWGWTHTIACCLGENKTPERHFIFLHRDQVGRGAEACGGEGLEEEEVE